MKVKGSASIVIRNSLFGIVSAILMVLLNFAVRLVLVKTLGDEYYGLHSLFQSVTSILALLELGLSSAMIIHLYEPVKNHDINTVKALLCFFRKAYLILALAFFILSIIVCTFIPSIVTSSIDKTSIRLFFAVFAASYVVDFATYHKRCLLFADQKNYISTISTTICELVFRGMQIVVLLTLGNYLLFLFLIIIEKYVSNLLCNLYIAKYYPELKGYKNKILSREKRDAFGNTIKPLFVNQISGTAQKASTGIIISALLGNVSIVGYFANYQLVMSTMELIYSQMGGAFTTTFGSLSVDGEKEDLYKVFRKTSFLMNTLCLLLLLAFLFCIQDFIALLFGETFLLSSTQVVLIGVIIWITLYNIPFISVQNAMGLHRIDAKLMFTQALLVVILGVVGGKCMGLDGILLGLIIPSFSLSTYNKGRLINQMVFQVDRKSFAKQLVFDIIVALLYCIPATVTIYFLPSSNSHLVLLIEKAIVVLIIWVVCTCLFFRNSEYFKYIIELIKSYIK